MSITMTPLQYFSLLSIIPLAFYNHKKGKGHPLPYFFYLYYPLHLAIIYLLASSL
ncbi:TraX family protein [Sharpea azabuensis]